MARIPWRVALVAPFTLLAVAADEPAATAKSAAPEPALASSQPRLDYYGGRVVSAPQLWLVPWGGGRQAPYVTGTGAQSIAGFLESLGPSGYLAGLDQYRTDRAALDGSPGTGQVIGPARFAGTSPITPSVAAAHLDDAGVRRELERQVTSGKLAAPAVDGAGNPVTVYLVFLPVGTPVTVDGQTSCQDLCAYHGTLEFGGIEAYYAVIPDMSAGSGCDAGCGGGRPFDNVTSVTSHELVEVITDPEVGLSKGLAPPLAWYDPAGGEIADVCNGQDAAVPLEGVRYTLQRWWSNADRACVVKRGEATAVASAAPRAAGAAGSVALARTRALLRASTATEKARAGAPAATAPSTASPPKAGAAPAQEAEPAAAPTTSPEPPAPAPPEDD